MKRLLQSLSLGLAFIVFCGFGYPLLVTGVGQIAFHSKANGSMIKVDGKVVGSALIGQDFTDARFFQGRVSAVNYDTFPAGTKPQDMLPASGSANLSVSNPELTERIKTDVATFLKAHPTLTEKDLPADLFTSSFSGLDPDISPADAEIQVDGIVKATGIQKSKIEQIIKDNSTGRDLGIFGEPCVNVLEANLDIYKLIQGK
jgi:K+-transporting ATPase ATPase C chain